MSTAPTWTDADRRRIMDRRYRKTRALRLLRGESTSLVPAAPAREHLDRLVRIGWSFRALEEMAGSVVTDVTLSNLWSGVHGTVERKTAAAAMSIPYTLAPTAGVSGETFVPLAGAQRRVHALMRLGWPHGELRKRAATDTGHIARGTYSVISARRWHQIAALYDELCMMPGPSHITATRARAAGFVPPLAYEDIDDPDERPRGHNKATGVGDDLDPVVVERLLAGERVPSSPAEKREAMRRWVAAGNSARSLAARHGWQDGRYNPREDGAA